MCLIRRSALLRFLFFFHSHVLVCVYACVCMCACVQHDNLSVYVVRGAKQISNPQLNPSSCSDYKSAGALRSNQQEQSAAGTDTLSIRGDHHTVTHTHTHTHTHTAAHINYRNTHSHYSYGRHVHTRPQTQRQVCRNCNSTSPPCSLFPPFFKTSFFFSPFFFCLVKRDHRVATRVSSS